MESRTPFILVALESLPDLISNTVVAYYISPFVALFTGSYFSDPTPYQPLAWVLLGILFIVSATCLYLSLGKKSPTSTRTNSTLLVIGIITAGLIAIPIGIAILYALFVLLFVANLPVPSPSNP
jgi:hypothetical protein